MKKLFFGLSTLIFSLSANEADLLNHSIEFTPEEKLTIFQKADKDGNNLIDKSELQQEIRRERAYGQVVYDLTDDLFIQFSEVMADFALTKFKPENNEMTEFTFYDFLDSQQYDIMSYKNPDQLYWFKVNTLDLWKWFRILSNF